jgi:hypothetical protein
LSPWTKDQDSQSSLNSNWASKLLAVQGPNETYTREQNRASQDYKESNEWQGGWVDQAHDLD